jgi:hypothetical protein
MKRIPCRVLVREPLKVKRMTRAGNSVQVTDNGQPLWILQPANGIETDGAERRRAIDEIPDEVLHEKPSKISAASLLGLSSASGKLTRPWRRPVPKHQWCRSP